MHLTIPPGRLRAASSAWPSPATRGYKRSGVRQFRIHLIASRRITETGDGPLGQVLLINIAGALSRRLGRIPSLDITSCDGPSFSKLSSHAYICALILLADGEFACWRPSAVNATAYDANYVACDPLKMTTTPSPNRPCAPHSCLKWQAETDLPWRPPLSSTNRYSGGPL